MLKKVGFCLSTMCMGALLLSGITMASPIYPTPGVYPAVGESILTDSSSHKVSVDWIVFAPGTYTVDPTWIHATSMTNSMSGMYLYTYQLENIMSGTHAHSLEFFTVDVGSSFRIGSAGWVNGKDMDRDDVFSSGTTHNLTGELEPVNTGSTPKPITEVGINSGYGSNVSWRFQDPITHGDGLPVGYETAVMWFTSDREYNYDLGKSMDGGPTFSGRVPSPTPEPITLLILVSSGLFGGYVVRKNQNA